MSAESDIWDSTSKEAGPAPAGNATSNTFYNYGSGIGAAPASNVGAAPWTGPAGQGYYDPSTGNINYQYAPAGSAPLNRAGIDKRLQGNLEDPYAGYYGGAPGIAENEEARYAGLAQQARMTPGAQIDNGQYNADRALEMGGRGNEDYAMQQYRNMIEGNGPSVAQRQMQLGLAQSNAQQASIAAGARGGGANLAAAQQAASNAAGQASGNIVGQAGLARVQEQLGALQGYGGLATNQRAQDLQRQGLSAEQAYRQAQIEEAQRQLNAQTALGYENMRQNTFQQQQQGMEYNESENQNAYMGGTGLGQQQSEQASRERQAYTGAAVSGAGTLISALSDIRSKKEIGDGRSAVREQLTEMSPYSYDYKNPEAPGAGPGRRVGVMAQDMERGPYGHQLVRNTPQGKQIDGPGGLSLALAGTADHEKRLQALEGGGSGMYDMSRLTPEEWQQYYFARNAASKGAATPAEQRYMQAAESSVPYAPVAAPSFQRATPASLSQMVAMPTPAPAPESMGDRVERATKSTLRDYAMGGIPGATYGLYRTLRGLPEAPPPTGLSKYVRGQ